jgi:ATP-dependent 26S proteasome regulatory subunit
MPRAQQAQAAGEPEPVAPELAQENQRLRRTLERTQAAHLELRALVEGLTAPPWYPALLQRVVETEAGRRALVWVGASPRLVALHPELDPESFAAGEHVYLDHQQSTVLARANGGFVPPTETATFVRLAPDGRLAVRVRDDELLLECAARFDAAALCPGDSVLFDRPSRLALERLPGSAGQQYLLEDVGELARERVGGHRESLDELVAVLTAALVDPELARAYGLAGRRAILLYGPPGCGKTLLARTAASEVQRRSGRRCRFAVVRPGEFESPYVGESEANIRSCFERLREAAADGLSLLFLDEIESIGRTRGALGARHSDRFLAALLAEVDGFRARGSVAILAATNRRDLLDPALLSRLSDVEIPVPRPDLRAAREIFAVHLPESLPYARRGECGAPASESREAAGIRQEVVETAVSLLHAPNAENEIARLTLRDGTQRTVRARELASGRLIEQICLAAREKAFRRHARGEGAGVSCADAADAVADALARLATTLSVHNARAHLDDLPQDIDVVRVEPIRARPERRHRYLHAC